MQEKKEVEVHTLSFLVTWQAHRGTIFLEEYGGKSVNRNVE
jgi:hypothetical protein